MKLRKLNIGSPQASRGDNLGITLFVRESDGKIVYKETDGTIREVLDDTSSTITTLQNTTSNLEYTYTEVAVSSAEILAAHSSPVEILAAAAAGTYYDYYGKVEYTHVGTNYSLPSNDAIGIFDNQSYAGTLFESFGTRSKDLIFPFNSDTSEFPENATGQTNTNLLNVKLPQYKASSLILTTYGGGALITGNGTLLIKIWYKVKTFGTEL